MIEVEISPQMLSQAKKKAEEMGLIKNSIMKGDGSVAGFVGEFIAESVLGGKVDNTYEYDLIAPCGSTVDVKTKRTKVKPKDYYDCSIAAYNIRQKCDYYAFVRVLNDFSKGWFLGWIKKVEYFDKGRFLKEGDRDGDNGFLVRSDCYNLKISELHTGGLN